MIDLCNILPAEPVPCNTNHKNKNMIAWTKKGMATKAFIKNMTTGNMKLLNKQIQKGTVKFTYQ